MTMSSGHEKRLELLTLADLQHIRQAQTGLSEEIEHIHSVSNIAKYSFAVLGLVNLSLIALTSELTPGNTSATAAAGAGCTAAHFAKRWSGNRFIHEQLELRTTERVIDRRLGINRELEQ